MEKKVNVYIDGQNFYYGLKNINLNPWYFDFKSYAEKELANSDDKTISQIKYYGARYPKELCQNKHNRDDAFYKALEKNQGLVIREGSFKIREVESYGRIKKIPNEKGVDVLLATDLIFDAFHGGYDCAYVLSSDTDIVPAIIEIKKTFKDIKIFNFSFNKLQEYKKACDYSAKIFENKAKKYINPSLFNPTNETLQDLINSFGTSKA